MEEKVRVRVDQPVKLYNIRTGKLTGMKLETGIHAMERIMNPVGKKGPWLVLPGQDVGLAELHLTAHGDGFVIDSPSVTASRSISTV